MLAFLSPTTLAIILSSFLLSDAKAYYVDRSCTERAGWQGAWDLAMRNARSAAARLGYSTDTDFERGVKMVFKVDRSDERFKKIREPFDEILSWTQVPQKESELETLKPADIRVFCDGDAKKEENGAGRWKQVGLVAWYDTKNAMLWYATAENPKPWCQVDEFEDGRGYKGYTYFPGPWPEQEQYENGKLNEHFGQNKERRVITICDYTFIDHYMETLDDGEMKLVPLIVVEQEVSELAGIDWDQKDHDNACMERFETLFAHTILHELIHAAGPNPVVEVGGTFVPHADYPGGIGDYPDINNAYNWHNVYKLDYDLAIKNADSYAEIALLAMLADHGYTIQRHVPYPGYEGEDQKDQVAWDAKTAAMGKISRYSDITSRGLRIMSRLFRDMCR